MCLQSTFSASRGTQHLTFMRSCTLLGTAGKWEHCYSCCAGEETEAQSHTVGLWPSWGSLQVCSEAKLLLWGARPCHLLTEGLAGRRPFWLHLTQANMEQVGWGPRGDGCLKTRPDPERGPGAPWGSLSLGRKSQPLDDQSPKGKRHITHNP